MTFILPLTFADFPGLVMASLGLADACPVAKVAENSSSGEAGEQQQGAGQRRADDCRMSHRAPVPLDFRSCREREPRDRNSASLAFA